MVAAIQKVKCGMCPIQMDPAWKDAKWCPDCKFWVCAHCRGGIKVNKCPKCKKPGLKMSGTEGAATGEAGQQKAWKPAPGGEDL
jgi:hypothetical protein